MLIELLQMLYRQESHLPAGTDFYDKCLQQIEADTLWGQVYNLLKASGSWRNVPDTFFEQVAAGYQLILAQNMFVRRQQVEILTQLDQRCVPTIPLKGVWFAERYFGHLGGRATSDIDILIRPADLSHAIQCLRELGFNGPLDYNPIHFHCVMWRRDTHDRAPLFVELHWDIVIRSTREDWPLSLWEDSEIRKPFRYVRELSVTQTFYTICLHGANHQLESLKYSLDIVQMLYRFGEQIDFSEILRQSTQDKTTRRIHLVLHHVYNEFPDLRLVKPLTAEYRKRPLVDRYGFTFPVLLIDDWKSRFRYLWHWLVPPRDVALWHMRDDRSVTSANVYYKFYRRRVHHMSRKFAKDSKGDKQYA